MLETIEQDTLLGAYLGRRIHVLQTAAATHSEMRTGRHGTIR